MLYCRFVKIVVELGGFLCFWGCWVRVLVFFVWFCVLYFWVGVLSCCVVVETELLDWLGAGKCPRFFVFLHCWVVDGRHVGLACG